MDFNSFGRQSILAPKRFVNFGHYPQSLVEDATTLRLLDRYYPSASEGEAVAFEGRGYVRSKGRWFLIEPIQWRVLEQRNGSALLLAEKLLDVQPFDAYSDDYRYSELKRWLHSNFFGNALKGLEKHLLPIGYESITLPSKEDLMNRGYGFDPDEDAPDQARKATPTDYAHFRGATMTDGFGWYWTRSTVELGIDCAYAVRPFGDLNYLSVSMDYGCIRPLICIKD